MFEIDELVIADNTFVTGFAAKTIVKEVATQQTLFCVLIPTAEKPFSGISNYIACGRLVRADYAEQAYRKYRNWQIEGLSDGYLHMEGE